MSEDGSVISADILPADPPVAPVVQPVAAVAPVAPAATGGGGGKPDDKRTDTERLITAYTGFTAMILAALAIVGVVGILFVQIWIEEHKHQLVPAATYQAGHCAEAACELEAAQMSLESDAQMLRTDRVRTAMMLRLFVFIVAELVGFSIAVLGAVLIFDRVISRSPNEVQLDSNRGAFSHFVARSEFPGFFLCLIGALVVGGTVWASTLARVRFEVYDVPVFLQDKNFVRTLAGYRSGFKPVEEQGTSADLTGAAAPAPSIPPGPQLTDDLGAGPGAKPAQP